MTETPGQQKYVSPDGWQPTSRTRPARVPTYKRLDVLSIVAVVSATAVGLLAVLEGILVWTTVDNYRRAIETDTIAWNVFSWADLVSIPLIGALVVAYVCNCLWLGRARANTAVLTRGAAQHDRESTWVWLGWWMPIVALWFPYQVVRDVRNGSIELVDRKQLLGLWWAAWLVLLLAWRVGDALASSRDVLSEGTITTMAVCYSISALAAAIGCFLWFRIVRDVTRAQEASAFRLWGPRPAA